MALGLGWCIAATVICIWGMHIDRSWARPLNASLFPVALFGGAIIVALTPAGIWRRLLIVILFLPLAYATVFLVGLFVQIVIFRDLV